LSVARDLSGASIGLSVMIPAYQEEENLRILLPRILGTLKVLEVGSEVLVVDTTTPLDATRELCEQLDVRWLARQGGNAFGDAYRTGIAHARGEFILFMDADGSHPPECIPRLFQFRDQYDVVVASRYVEQGYTENSRTLVLMSRVLNWTYSFVLGIDCKDVSNSFRLCRAAQLRPLTLKCENFDIVEEVLLKLNRTVQGLRIREVPFTFKQRMFGKTKRNLFVFMISYVVTLVRLRFFV
jgi:dolichol-phosphate mannosyltransferase